MRKLCAALLLTAAGMAAGEFQVIQWQFRPTEFPDTIFVSTTGTANANQLDELATGSLWAVYYAPTGKPPIKVSVMPVWDSGVKQVKLTFNPGSLKDVSLADLSKYTWKITWLPTGRPPWRWLHLAAPPTRVPDTPTPRTRMTPTFM